MSKSKSVIGGAVALTSLGAVESLRQQIAALSEQANQAEVALKVETENKVKVEVAASCKRIGAILGREINLGELLPIVSAMSKDKPLFASSAKVGNTAQLTDAKRDEVRAALKARAAALKMGQPAKPISVIARELGVTDQTAANYKPTKAEVDLMPGTAEVPTNAYQAAA